MEDTKILFHLITLDVAGEFLDCVSGIVGQDLAINSVYVQQCYLQL